MNVTVAAVFFHMPCNSSVWWQCIYFTRFCGKDLLAYNTHRTVNVPCAVPWTQANQNSHETYVVFFSLSHDIIAKVPLLLVAVGEHGVSETSHWLQLASHSGLFHLSNETVCSLFSSLKKAQFDTAKNSLSGHYHLNFLPFPSLQVMTRVPKHFINCWGVSDFPHFKILLLATLLRLSFTSSLKNPFPEGVIIYISPFSHIWVTLKLSQCMVPFYPRLAVCQSGFLSGKPCWKEHTGPVKPWPKSVIVRWLNLGFVFKSSVPNTSKPSRNQTACLTYRGALNMDFGV